MNFSNKYGILDSMAEKIIYDLLTEEVDTRSYRIFPQLLLHTVLGIEFDDLQQKLDTFSKAFADFNYEATKTSFSPELLRFDFVICNENFLPVLVLEVNGPLHKTNSRYKFYDKFKRYILEVENIKLITLDTDAFYNRNQQDNKYDIDKARQILIAKLYEFNQFSTLTCYCPKCQNMKLRYTKSKANIYYLQCDNCKNNSESPYGWNEEEYAKYFKPLLKMF